MSIKKISNFTNEINNENISNIMPNIDIVWESEEEIVNSCYFKDSYYLLLKNNILKEYKLVNNKFIYQNDVLTLETKPEFIYKNDKYFYFVKGKDIIQYDNQKNFKSFLLESDILLLNEINYNHKSIILYLNDKSIYNLEHKLIKYEFITNDLIIYIRWDNSDENKLFIITDKGEHIYYNYNISEIKNIKLKQKKREIILTKIFDNLYIIIIFKEFSTVYKLKYDKLLGLNYQFNINNHVFCIQNDKFCKINLNIEYYTYLLCKGDHESIKNKFEINDEIINLSNKKSKNIKKSNIIRGVILNYFENRYILKNNESLIIINNSNKNIIKKFDWKDIKYLIYKNYLIYFKDYKYIFENLLDDTNDTVDKNISYYNKLNLVIYECKDGFKVKYANFENNTYNIHSCVRVFNDKNFWFFEGKYYILFKINIFGKFVLAKKIKERKFYFYKDLISDNFMIFTNESETEYFIISLNNYKKSKIFNNIFKIKTQGDIIYIITKKRLLYVFNKDLDLTFEMDIIKIYNIHKEFYVININYNLEYKNQIEGLKFNFYYRFKDFENFIVADGKIMNKISNRVYFTDHDNYIRSLNNQFMYTDDNLYNLFTMQRINIKNISRLFITILKYTKKILKSYINTYYITEDIIYRFNNLCLIKERCKLLIVDLIELKIIKVIEASHYNIITHYKDKILFSKNNKIINLFDFNSLSFENIMKNFVGKFISGVNNYLIIWNQDNILNIYYISELKLSIPDFSRDIDRFYIFKDIWNIKLKDSNKFIFYDMRNGELIKEITVNDDNLKFFFYIKNINKFYIILENSEIKAIDDNTVIIEPKSKEYFNIFKENFENIDNIKNIIIKSDDIIIETTNSLLFYKNLEYFNKIENFEKFIEFKYPDNICSTFIVIYKNDIKFFLSECIPEKIIPGKIKNYKINNYLLFLEYEEKFIVLSLNNLEELIFFDSSISHYEYINLELIIIKDSLGFLHIYLFNKLKIKIDKKIIDYNITNDFLIVIELENKIFQFYSYKDFELKLELNNLLEYKQQHNYLFITLDNNIVNVYDTYFFVQIDTFKKDFKQYEGLYTLNVVENTKFIEVISNDECIINYKHKYNSFILKNNYLVIEGEEEILIYYLLTCKIIKRFKNCKIYYIKNIYKYSLFEKKIDNKSFLVVFKARKVFDLEIDITGNYKVFIKNNFFIIKTINEYIIYDKSNLKIKLGTIPLGYENYNWGVNYILINNNTNFVIYDTKCDKKKEFIMLSDYKEKNSNEMLILQDKSSINVFNKDITYISTLFFKDYNQEYEIIKNENCAYLKRYELIILKDSSIYDNPLVKSDLLYFYYILNPNRLIILNKMDFNIAYVKDIFLQNIEKIQIIKENIIVNNWNNSLIEKKNYNYIKVNIDFMSLMILNEINNYKKNKLEQNLPELYKIFFIIIKDKYKIFENLKKYFVFIIFNAPKFIIENTDDFDILNEFFNTFGFNSEYYISYIEENPLNIAIKINKKIFIFYLMKNINQFNSKFPLNIDNFWKIIDFFKDDNFLLKKIINNFFIKNKSTKLINLDIWKIEFDLLIIGNNNNFVNQEFLNKIQDKNGYEQFAKIKNFSIKIPINFYQIKNLFLYYSKFNDVMKLSKIKYIIYYYWKKIKYIKFIYFIIYFIMLLLLLLKIVYLPQNLPLFILTIFFNVLLFINEIFKLKFYKIYYFTNIFNIFNIILILANISNIIFTQFISQVVGNIFNLIIIYLNGFKLISLLRIFDLFRKQIKLLNNSIVKSFNFLLLVFINLAYISFINILNTNLNDGSKNYFYALNNVYNIMLGNWGYDFRGDFNYKNYIEFIFNTFIFTIILLNLYVSVVSEIFNDYNTNKELYDLEEINNLLIEYSYISVIFKNSEEKEFIYIISKKDNSKESLELDLIEENKLLIDESIRLKLKIDEIYKTISYDY